MSATPASHVWGRVGRRLRSLAEEAGLDALILAGKPNIIYATGIREPSGVMIVSDKCGDYLITPLLDYHRMLLDAPREVEVLAAYRKGEEDIKPPLPESEVIDASPTEAALKILDKCGDVKIGSDMEWQPYNQARVLAERGVVDVSGRIRKLRSIKDEWEIEAIVRAVGVAEEALRTAINSIREGVSEAEVASLINSTIASNGGWREAFPSIVAFYQNTAYPHHTPRLVRLGKPGPILVDLGAVVDGYHSDMTRSFWWGPGGVEYRGVVEAVLEAQAAAIDRIAPGVEAWEPDKDARRALERHGLARYFIHGLGHGVGVEIHEEPYMRPGMKTLLEPGMIVTVEPGVYINGLYGVRIEDLALVTSKGRRILTSFSRIIDLP